MTTDAPPRVAVDTNVLVYAEGEGDAARCSAARDMLTRLRSDRLVVPVQVLGELHRVLTRRARRSAAEARESVLEWADMCHVRASSFAALKAATDLHADHGLQIWDALILAVASEDRCRILLSEDMQHGFTWGGVTVVNPFHSEPHPLLALALS